MKYFIDLRLVAAAGAVLMTVGCKAPEFNMVEMAAGQKAIPAQMDQLKNLVGSWHTTYTSEMMGADGEIVGSGNSETKLELGGRYLVEKMDSTMITPDGTVTMSGVGVWTWDDHAKKYRTWWFDNWGGVGTGTATYNSETETFTMRGKGRDMVHGHKSGQRGTMRFIDDDTMEWTWCETDSLGLIKYFEMTGTSKLK